ncbi:helix-turn-helix domain-containing protein [Paeniglutamicibacter antarcticus]|uniref:Helix-turn-helix domain-containing protein n=1 Tax=Paeniglutamicibacter antarcticus TaxID=494023 RepID=A0ABP9TG11_9MICC
MELIQVPNTSELKCDPEWLRLIAQLRERRAALVEDFQVRFPAEHFYDDKVSSEEIRSLIGSTMDMYLILLGGGKIVAELERLPFELGRRRARQGVSAEQLLEGVRTNSRVIWNALREIATDKTMGALVRNTDAVLGLVEWHVQAVQSSYLREEELLNRYSAQRRQRTLAKIFTDPLPDRNELISIALDLGVGIDAVFDVSLQLGPHEMDCRVCESHESPVYVHELIGGTCHFSPCATGSFDNLPPHMHIACIPSVAGLAKLPDAVQAGLAIVEARASRRPSAVAIDSAWPAVAWKNLVQSIPAELLPIDLDGIAGVPRHDRQRLVETVSTYSHTGSIKETAEAHFCHRNTVVKRLARFEQLTGANLGIPIQAALAILAITSINDDLADPC